MTNEKEADGRSAAGQLAVHLAQRAVAHVLSLLPDPGRVHAETREVVGAKRTEIIELGVKHPKLLARALDMERAARPKLKGSVKGLGRSYAWETHVNEDRGQLQLWC